jgi:hypothetical protein
MPSRPSAASVTSKPAGVSSFRTNKRFAGSSSIWRIFGITVRLCGRHAPFGKQSQALRQPAAAFLRASRPEFSHVEPRLATVTLESGGGPQLASALNVSQSLRLLWSAVPRALCLHLPHRAGLGPATAGSRPTFPAATRASASAAARANGASESFRGRDDWRVAHSYRI